MSSSEEDVVAVYWWLQQNERNRKKRRYWVHPYNVRNIKHSSAVVSRELAQHAEKFKEMYRMSPDTFHLLEQIVSATLQKQDTNFRLAVSPAEKLLITIR